MANSNYWKYNSDKFGKTTQNRYDAKSKANSDFISHLSPEVNTKLEQLGITPGLFTTAGGDMSYELVLNGVDEIARLQRALGYSSNPTEERNDWGDLKVASGVIDQKLLDLLNSGAVKIETSQDGHLIIRDGDDNDSIKIADYTSSLFKPKVSGTSGGGTGGTDGNEGGGDATKGKGTTTVVQTPAASSVKYTGPISYTDGYGSRHFGKAYLNRELYNNQGYGLKRQKHGNNVAARDLDLYALMRDSGTAGSGYNENHYLGALLRQAVGFSRDEDLSSVEKRDEVLARLYNTFGVRGRLGAYDRGRLRRDLEKYLRSKEAAEGKAWGYYYNNTNTDGNMNGNIEKLARGGRLKSPFDYSTPITRFQKGGAMKNQKNISPKEKEELTKAFLAWAESKDIPKEKLIQVMQIAENPNSDPKQRKAATEQIQTLYEQFIAEMQQSQQQTQAQVAALGAKLNYVNKLRRLQVGGALDMEEEGAFDENAELQTQFISWLMDAQGLSEEEAVSFLDELMSGQYSEEEVAPILNQFYEDLESIQGYKKGGCVKKRQEGGSVSTREHLTRMVPFYGTYKDFQDGNYGSGVINGVGDLLILGGAGAIGRRAKNFAKAKSLLKAKQSAEKAYDKFHEIGNEAYRLATKLGKTAREQANLALERNYDPTLRTNNLQQYNSAMEGLAQELSLIRRRYPYTWDLVAPTGNFFVNYSNALRAMTRGEAADKAANIAKRKVAQYSNALKRVDNRPFSTTGKILLAVPPVAAKAVSRMVSKLSGESDNMQTK